MTSTTIYDYLSEHGAMSIMDVAEACTSGDIRAVREACDAERFGGLGRWREVPPLPGGGGTWYDVEDADER